jgi:hypothetical protein
MGRVSRAMKAELVAAVGDRDRACLRAERTKILDEFVAVTGYHRKHAIRLLRPKISDEATAPRRVHRRYGMEIQQALIVLWEASDRLCSKRLKPIIPVLLPALERHGQLTIDETIRALLLASARRRSIVCFRRCVWWHAAVAGGVPASARLCVVPCRCGRSETGTIRRRVLSRSILSLMPAPRRPGASSRRWC